MKMSFEVFFLTEWLFDLQASVWIGKSWGVRRGYVEVEVPLVTGEDIDK